MPLISIQNLSLNISNVQILKEVSLEIGQEKFGLIGESGSGKSMLAKTLLGVLPLGANVQADILNWKGKDLTTINEKMWREIRGSEIAMILQDAKTSLNPLMNIKKQLQEVSSATTPLSALQQVQLPSPEEILQMYPHQLSGGMGQRVMIAMMLMQNPKFLIADEIVSALDSLLQHEILTLLQDHVKERQMGLLFISHDLQQACQFCDRIGVMKEGQLLAVDTPAELRKNAHPYIQRLFDAMLPEEPK